MFMIWTAQHFKNVSSPQVINRVIVIPLKIPVICWMFLICGNGQADLKTYVEMQRTKNSQDMLRKKNKVLGLF